MAKMSALALVFMAALAYGSAEATVFVVDPTPPACVQPSGGVLVPTIGAAVTAAGAGDRIYVCPGTYPENVVVAPTQSNLTLLGIDRPKLVPGDPGQPGLTILASGVRVQGFDVAGFQGSQFTCGMQVGAPIAVLAPASPPSGVIVIGNVVHDSGVGVCFVDAGGNELRDNTVEGNVYVGIADIGLSGPTSPNLIIGNRVRRNLQGGIAALGNVTARVDMNEVTENGIGIVLQAAVGGRVSRNTVLRNQLHGIVATGGCCFGIEHNTVRENAQFGIRVANVTGCSVDDNSVARNGSDGLSLEDIASCQVFRNVVQQNLAVGISAHDLGAGDIFLFNTASGNRVLDCDWDGSDTPTFTANRCLTENPPGAWD